VQTQQWLITLVVAFAMLPMAATASEDGIVIEPRVLDAGLLLGVDEYACRFTIRNNTDKTVILGDAKTSCSCSKAQLSRTELRAGESCEMTFSIRTAGIKGEFTSGVTVMTADGDMTATASIRGRRNEVITQVDVLSLEGDVSQEYIDSQCRFSCVSIGGASASDVVTEITVPSKSFEAELHPASPEEQEDGRWVYRLQCRYRPSLDTERKFQNGRIVMPIKITADGRSLHGHVVAWTKVHYGFKVTPEHVRVIRRRQANKNQEAVNTVRIEPTTKTKVRITHVEAVAPVVADLSVTRDNELSFKIAESLASDTGMSKGGIKIYIEVGEVMETYMLPVFIYGSRPNNKEIETKSSATGTEKRGGAGQEDSGDMKPAAGRSQQASDSKGNRPAEHK